MNNTVSSSRRTSSLPVTLSLAFLLALLPSLTGCVAAAAAGAASAVAYVRGALETTVTADYGKVVKATQAALKQLEFSGVNEKKDALRGEFTARTALDKKVEINLTKTGDKQTKVEIRIGYLGDQELSMAILDKIKANL